ncbi:hypothetical protein Hanom_Chr16g01485461 [Helianthus anomalus]
MCRKISFGFSSTKLTRRLVVSACRLLRRVKGSQPHTVFLAGITDLRRVPTPRPLPYASKMRFFCKTDRFSGTGTGECLFRGH